MPLEVAGLNVAANAVGAAFSWVGLFDDDPTAGGVEITGGTPPYARKQLDFSSAAVDGVDTALLPVTIDVPAGAVVTYAALFNAEVGGTRGGYGSVPPAGPYQAQGTYTVLAAHVSVL